MSEEREEQKPAAPGEEGVEGGASAGREASAWDDREDGWPLDEWNEDEWDKDDWDEDGRPDEVTPEGGAADSPERVPGVVIGRPAARSAGGAQSVGDMGNAVPLAPEESQGEATRRSGIAYAAGLALFLTVVSFMGLGWLLDNWLGTNWMLVAGIVVGAVAGFTQFVRIITRLK
jgi:hypothetical protein